MFSLDFLFISFYFLLGSTPTVLIVVSFSRLYLKTLYFFSFELYTFFFVFFPLFVVILEEKSVSIAFRSHLQRSGLQHTK